GMLIAHEVAKTLGTRMHFTEREGEGLLIRRGVHLDPGARVLVGADALTTGGAVREGLGAVRRSGAVLVGVGLLVDRSGGEVFLGAPTEALLHLDAREASYAPAECPLCRAGVPFTARGSRHTAGA